MNLKWDSLRLGAALILCAAVFPAAQAQVNSWTNSLNGVHKWEDSTKWSLAIPPATSHSVFITNGVGVIPRSRTVSIDATTAGGFPGTMTVSNLTVAVTPPGIGVNTLSLNNTGATNLGVRGSLTISRHGNLTVTNSFLHVGLVTGFEGFVGDTFSVDGSVVLNSGTIVTFESCGLLCFRVVPTIIGNTSTGAFTVANGRWRSGPVKLGSSAATYGTLTISGGSVTMSPGLSAPVNSLDVVNGSVWLVGGELHTASDVMIGDGSGAGQMTISNGTWTTSVEPRVGVSGGNGTLTVAGGMFLPTQLAVGVDVNSQGALWVNGGQFVTSDLTVGQRGLGQLTQSNGTVRLSSMYLGFEAGSAGTFNMAGGNSSVLDSLQAGNFNAQTGTVVVSGGALAVTNAGNTALLELRRGTLSVTGGKLIVDRLIATNILASIGFTAGNIILRGANVLSLAPTGIDNTAVLDVVAGTNDVEQLGAAAVGMNATGMVFVTGANTQLRTTSVVVQSQDGVAIMAVSNGTWQANVISVAESSPAIGTLTLAGGTTTVANVIYVGKGAAIQHEAHGRLWLTGGRLDTRSRPVYVGFYGNGSMTVSSGTWMAGSSHVGYQTHSQGTLTFVGGNSEIEYLQIGGATDPNVHQGTGTVWMTGGSLTMTNGTFEAVIGDTGVGRMTVSNGTWRAHVAKVGINVGSQGTLTVAGGTNALSFFLIGNWGTVWMTDGQLTVAERTTIGEPGTGIGQMTISNGNWHACDVRVGNEFSTRGALTIAGGVSSVHSNLTLGTFDCAGTGVVNVAGGSLLVTNATGNAVLDVRSGTFTMSGGLVQFDRLVVSNDCARFIRTAGTLVQGSVFLHADFDADGDGLPNGWEQQFGLDPLDPTGANGADGDPDEDELTNGEEFMIGSDPTEKSSPFRIISVAQEGIHFRVNWTTAGGHTNVLEAGLGAGGGNFATNNFGGIVTNFTPAMGIFTNTFLHPGGATNNPAGYYRVRLVP